MRPQILVPVHTYPDGNAVSLAGHVAATATRLGADVHALVLNADFPRPANVLGNALLDMPAMIGGAKEKCRERGEAVLKAIERELGQKGVPLRTSKTECFPGVVGEIVSRSALYHDFVLVGISASDVAMQDTAEAVIFGSGKPTLLVPESAPVSNFDHVMIAWDASRVAARAISDARDFLQRAKTVTVVSVTDEKALPDNELGNRLVAYLARHDIKATAALVQRHGRPIAEALQENAKKIGAGLLIMGGFGHSRLRDFVLGGATGGILKDLRIAVLLSH